MTASKGCLIVLGCLSLVACAGTPPKRALPSDDVDAQKVAIVNQWAEAHGARLIWLNYPTRNAGQKVASD